MKGYSATTDSILYELGTEIMFKKSRTATWALGSRQVRKKFKFVCLRILMEKFSIKIYRWAPETEQVAYR